MSIHNILCVDQLHQEFKFEIISDLFPSAAFPAPVAVGDVAPWLPGRCRSFFFEVFDRQTKPSVFLTACHDRMYGRL